MKGFIQIEYQEVLENGKYRGTTALVHYTQIWFRYATPMFQSFQVKGDIFEIQKKINEEIEQKPLGGEQSSPQKDCPVNKTPPTYSWSRNPFTDTDL